MASAVEEERGAYMMYSLFNKYASGPLGHSTYGVASISYTRMKQLMSDMDLLEGVPPGLADVFVREHLQRADQEGSGVLGAQDFIVWLLTEVAALLPVRDAFCSLTGLRPLYNQFHAVLLGDVGFTDGARRPALGMQAAQFHRLAEEYGLSTSSESVRYAFKAARASIGAFRASSGANTGAQMAEPAGGGRLQFAAFVRALAMLAAQRMGSLDVALYQVVSCGVAPNFVDPRVSRPSLSREVLASMGLYSRLEGSCTKEPYTCGNCGQEHQRWRLNNWIKLEELLLSLGIPHPVRRYMQALPYINARNLRAAFHRYNAMYNKGKMPPASYRLPKEGDGGAARTTRGGGGTANGGAGDGGEGESVPEPAAAAAGSCAGGGGCCSQPAAYGACCCLFRSLSAMEMSAWLRLCGDCDAIRELIATHGSGVTPATLEAAFVQASSIAGAYCPDDSSGIHDLPIAEGEGGAKLGLPRNHLGAVVASEARVAPDKPAPKRSTAAYQAPPDGHPMAMAAAAAGAGIAPRLHEVQGPNTAAAWLASARSLPYGSGGGGGAAAAAGAAGSASRGQQHRPSRLTLTFPQFVEALRLVAEEAGGHPTRTAAAERALLRIVHDLVREGCPRPDPTTASGTAALRRMRSGRGGTASNQPAEEEAEPPAQPPVHDYVSATTSTTTSTKYTYADFTPPESNLYTSATSSSVGSRPTSARGGGNSGGNASGLVQSSKGTSGTSSTSTKYTYDDFTPPDSEQYTSASSSSRGGGGGGGGGGSKAQSQPLASQSWRPQPVKSLGNLKTSYANAAVAAASGGGGGGGGGSKSTPAQLQPKRRSSVVTMQAPATAAAAAAAAAPPPPPAAIWAMTMPPPPSARIQPVNPPTQASTSPARRRPESAPRVRPPTAPPAGAGDGRVEYVPGGQSTGDQTGSRPRPASARQLVGTYVGSTEPSSYFPSAAVANPPFATRATRPASASAQRSRPYSAGDASARPKSPPPPHVAYPATYAAAAAGTAGGRIVYEPPGISGQLRPSSAPRVRPSSANAAIGRTGGAVQQPSGSYGIVRPLSRSSNIGPSGAGQRQQQQQPKATAGAVAATATPSRPSFTSAWRTSGNGRSGAAGTGFVSPIFPEPYIPGSSSRGGSGGGGGADGRPRSPPPRMSAAASAAATAMSAEAAAAAALAAAAGARHTTMGRPPLPYGAAAAAAAATALGHEHTLVTVHPNTAPGARVVVGGGGSASGGSSGYASASGSRGPSATSIPGNAGSANSGGSGGEPPAQLQTQAAATRGSGAAGLRNLMLLQAVDQPGPAAPAAPAPSRATYDNDLTADGGAGGAQHSPSGRPSGAEPWAADAADPWVARNAMRRTDSAAERRRRDAAPEPPPFQSGKPSLEHAVLSDDAAPVPVRLISRTDSADRAPANTAGEGGEDGEAVHEDGKGPWGGIMAAVARRDDAASSVGGLGIGFGAGDDVESTEGASPPSPRAVLAASQSTRAVGQTTPGRSRLPAEGTVTNLPQFFFA